MFWISQGWKFDLFWKFSEFLQKFNFKCYINFNKFREKSPTFTKNTLSPGSTSVENFNFKVSSCQSFNVPVIYSRCLQVFIVNLVYDFYRNWSTLKKTIKDVRWNQDSYKFARRMFSVLVSMTIFLLARLALLQGSLPRFSQQDNPAAFHPSFQTRLLTFLYLSSFNLWLLLCPSQLVVTYYILLFIT